MKNKNEGPRVADWWTEWLQEWPARESRDKRGRLKYGKEGARRAVEAVLSGLKAPMAEITPAALHEASIAAGIGIHNHEPRVLTRDFLLWCQDKEYIPLWIQVRGVRQAVPRKAATEKPNTALANKVEEWAAQADPKRRVFMRAVINVVLRLPSDAISPEGIVASVSSLGYTESYCGNVVAALRDFLHWGQTKGVVSGQARLRRTNPMALRKKKLPLPISDEIEGVLKKYYGPRRKGPICEDTKDLIRREFQRFFNALALPGLAPGADFKRLRDFFPKKDPFQYLVAYRDYLQKERNPYNGEKVPGGTCRKKIIQLIMLFNRAHEQGVAGIPFIRKHHFPLPDDDAKMVPCLLPVEESAKLGSIDESLIQDLGDLRQLRLLRDALMVVVQVACVGRQP